MVAFCCLQIALLGGTARATTYYLAAGGNDANTGLNASQPWLTPNHPVACGDVILAAPSTSYYSENFNSGKWGAVSCSGKNNVAWLQCQTFDACKIYSTNYGINVDQSYWGVQGFEVTIASGAPGFCFGTAPSYQHPTEVHHIIFANNVANGCQAGGFSTWNYNSTAGVDYVSIIGNVVYNAAAGNSECHSGISIFQPVQLDSAPGTHIFIGGNFSWGNYQPSSCGGVQAWGASGIIFDTLDGSQGLAHAYTAQTVAMNNMLLSNGGHGIEIQNNIAGSQHAPILLLQNTTWGNEQQSNQQYNHLCGEILINSGYNIQEAYNLVATSSQNACAGLANADYALTAYTVDGSVWVYDNFATGYSGQNAYVYNGGSYGLASNNVLGQNPYFNHAVTPGAPNCSGTGSVDACMASVVSGFTATNSAAKGMGFQKPGSQSYNAYFPQWVCSVNLPSGLVTKGC